MPKDILSVFLAETAVYELDKSVNSSPLISTVSNYLDISTAHDTEGKDSEEALCIDSALFLLYPDRGLELISLLDEECSGSCVETNLIFYHYLTNIIQLSYSL